MKKGEKRVRLSLEPTAEFVEQLRQHGKDLGCESLIGTIRSSVARSARVFEAQGRGTLLLEEISGDGEVELTELEMP